MNIARKVSALKTVIVIFTLLLVRLVQVLDRFYWVCWFHASLKFNRVLISFMHTIHFGFINHRRSRIVVTPSL